MLLQCGHSKHFCLCSLISLFSSKFWLVPACSNMFQLFWKAIARLEYVGITCRLRHPELTIHDLPDEMHEIEARCTDCNLSKIVVTHLMAL